MTFATKQIYFTLLLLLPLFTFPVQAVRLAQNEAGQVAIVPLYNTLGDLDTLMKVSAGPAYSAVRIQIRDPDGNRTESFNVYLAPDQAWQAALTMRPDGSWLTTSDEKCVLGTGGTTAVESQQSDAPLSSPYGYIEVLLMGHIDDPDIRSDIASQSCESLADRFSEEPWNSDGNAGFSTPTDSMRVLAQLINVKRGTHYGLEPVHLAKFRDRPFHVPPAEEFGLADVYNEGTGEGETRSLVCVDECKMETWADPRDAVASVLLSVAREADYVVNPSIGASSSFAILNPMHHYYTDGEFQEYETGLYVTESDSGSVNPYACTPIPTTPTDTCPPAIPLINPEALSTFTMALDKEPTGHPKPIPILGITGGHPITDEFLSGNQTSFNSGTAIIAFLNFNTPVLFSNDQTAYFGMPSIVLGFTELVNGELISPEGGRVRANYGTSALGTKVTLLPGDH